MKNIIISDGIIKDALHITNKSLINKLIPFLFWDIFIITPNGNIMAIEVFLALPTEGETKHLFQSGLIITN